MNKPAKLLPRYAFSVPEASEITGLSRSSINRLIVRGQLESCKVGGRRSILARGARKASR